MQDVGVDRMCRHVVESTVQMSLRKTSLALQAVLDGVRAAVAVAERVAGMKTLVRDMATVTTHDQVRSTKSDVWDRLLTVVVAAATATTESVNLLALELVLNPLSVRSVANERKNRPNALDEQSTLSGLCVIQSGLKATVSHTLTLCEEDNYLYTIIAIGIAQKLFQTRAIEQLPDQHLARRMLRDANTLKGHQHLCKK